MSLMPTIFQSPRIRIGVRVAFMNGIAKLILAASVLLLSGELAAQTFKCTNAAGKITYSGTKLQ
jgi:hypothetical protein